MEYSARFSGPEFSKAYGKWHHSHDPADSGLPLCDRRESNFGDTIIVDDVDLVANTSANWNTA